jgi:hypothetical protein
VMNSRRLMSSMGSPSGTRSASLPQAGTAGSQVDRAPLQAHPARAALRRLSRDATASGAS